MKNEVKSWNPKARKGVPNNKIQRLVKRVIDFSIAFILLIIFSPILFFVSFSIFTFMGSPIFFRQQRPGFMGQPFVLWKFRTMNDTFEKSGELLSDEKRLTPLGEFLRETSLDELPQLLNVVRGDLSLVGPRPLLMEYLPLYSKEQAKRHDVIPGITGWAQINGRNDISWERKFELDLWYIENWNLFLDLKILWLTGMKVLNRAGVNQEGHATVEKFKGFTSKWKV
ncbi:sugar transferase [bacterium]|nr:sugar transferase [bacterium]